MVPAQGEGNFDRAEQLGRTRTIRSSASGMRDTLVDESESPFDMAVHEEVRARVEEELRQISEPYRTTVILRDLEEMSYEEIAEITAGFAGNGEVATDARPRSTAKASDGIRSGTCANNSACSFRGDRTAGRNGGADFCD